MVEQLLLKNCSPWRAQARAEEKCEQEGATERNHCFLMVTTHSPPSCTTWWGSRGVWSEGVRLSLGNGGGKVLF